MKELFLQIRLWAFVIFNFIDAYSTLYLTNLGGWYELNPFSRILLQEPLIFILVKLVIPILFAILTWRARQYQYSYILSWIGFITYLPLAIYYILIFIFII